jgi:hypothetical protein
MSDFHQRLDEFEERLKLELGRLETSLKQQFVAYGQHIESLFNQGRESIASHIDVLRGTPISDEQSAATLLSNVNEELHKTPAAADLEAAKKEFAAANAERDAAQAEKLAAIDQNDDATKEPAKQEPETGGSSDEGANDTKQQEQ